MSKIDAHALISQDLNSLAKQRRRHFLPALVLVLAFLATMLTAVGLRPDLLDQPGYQLASQIVLWCLCLLVLPAIGLGLWFPRPLTKIGFILLLPILVFIGAVGLPDDSVTVSELFGHVFTDGAMCTANMLATGTVLLLIGYFSGAFIQRRRSYAVVWLSSGISIAAITTVTWHCSATACVHTLSSHLGGGLVLLGLSSLLAFRVRHRDQGEK